MSLLCRLAQGRGGAERLVESHLIPILGQCDFIEARPEMDQAFIGMSAIHLLVCPYLTIADNDSFLPSAMQRYHQLLLPALQVVMSIATTLGSEHLTANNQVRDQITMEVTH